MLAMVMGTYDGNHCRFYLSAASTANDCIVGFIVVGVLVGPSFLGIVQSHEHIESLDY